MGVLVFGALGMGEEGNKLGNRLHLETLLSTWTLVTVLLHSSATLGKGESVWKEERGLGYSEEALSLSEPKEITTK